MRIIDNFLEKKQFKELVWLFTECEQFPWYYSPNISNYGEGTGSNLFYLNHTFYKHDAPVSQFYENIFPICEKLDPRSLIRIRGNLYPSTEKLYEHKMHTDFPWKHNSAILSINTCDGYTKLSDGTKIESKANRAVIFDASEEHCSTTTTNTKARFNISINYF